MVFLVLFQGRDDLRQDAVMQQVFGMVNNLFKKEAATRKRNLNVRRYKVLSNDGYQIQTVGSIEYAIIFGY